MTQLGHLVEVGKFLNEIFQHLTGNHFQLHYLKLHSDLGSEKAKQYPFSINNNLLLYFYNRG